jgi:hypothetical protein
MPRSTSPDWLQDLSLSAQKLRRSDDLDLDKIYEDVKISSPSKKLPELASVDAPPPTPPPPPVKRDGALLERAEDLTRLVVHDLELDGAASPGRQPRVSWDGTPKQRERDELRTPPRRDADEEPRAHRSTHDADEEPRAHRATKEITREVLAEALAGTPRRDADAAPGPRRSDATPTPLYARRNHSQAIDFAHRPKPGRDWSPERAKRVATEEAAAWKAYWAVLNENKLIRLSWSFAPPDLTARANGPPPPMPGLEAFYAFCALGARREGLFEAGAAPVPGRTAEVVASSPDLMRLVWAFYNARTPRPSGARSVHRNGVEVANDYGMEPYSGCGYHPYCTRDCECLAGDCLLRLRDGSRRRMDALAVGDHVATGAGDYRRVVRLWPAAVDAVAVVEVAAGCFLTPNHPVRFGGAWRRAGELGAVEHRGRGVVYGLELEGHVDTVLVGDGAVVAAVGVYCGPAFGWNVFTRKSARCDRLRCAACDVCVDAALDFSKVAPADLDVEYAPYVADDDDDDDVGFVDRRPAMIAVG